MLKHDDPGADVQALEHPDTSPELPSERRPSSNEAMRALAPSRLPPELDVSPSFAKGRTEQRHGFIRRHPIVAAVGLPMILAAGASGYIYWDHASHFETTDDAFVAARQFPIAPKVAGYLTAVPVTDNQHVVAGQVIAHIDQRDYQNALAEAEAQVVAAQASIETLDAEIIVQQAQISTSQAQVDQTRASLVFAQQQAKRYQELARTAIAGTVQDAERYTSQLNQQTAAFQGAQAALKLAQQQIDVLVGQRASALANLARAKAQRDQAQLNLSYTAVIAEQPGRVVQLSAGVGEFAQPGTNLAMLVPDDTWVWANFKETQLDHIRPGEPVTLRIDAYPDRTISGHVASVQPGSGTAFSLLPAENATGNYVKIVQRVPVKVVMDNPPADVAIGPGMSVEPSVRVDPRPSLLERLEAVL